MADEVAAAEARRWIHGGDELAVLDVREHGQYGEGHLLFASHCPYSRLEIEAPLLVPNRAVRCLLCDDGDGLARRAARRLATIGYRRIVILAGGVPAWQAAGFGVFRGVNVPSKAFGELVEAAHHTPTISAEQLDGWRREGREAVLIDGRPLAEFTRMSIPGARCVPNGELLYRLPRVVGDPRVPIVIHCAGRTRGLIGAQSLISAGIINPVYALENGTQGWVLSGRALERGRHSPPLPEPAAADLEAGRALAAGLATRFGVPVIDAARLAEWRAERDRTLYLLDVRMEDEFAAGHPAGARHAPVVQLLQATDEWIAVRRARLALVDDNGVRAVIAALWLRQMGHDAVVVRDALRDMPVETGFGRHESDHGLGRNPAPITPAELMAADGGKVLCLDLRSSMAHRQGRIPGSRWTTRARLDHQPLADASLVVLVADDAALAGLAAIDIGEQSKAPVRLLDGGTAAWTAAGGRLEPSPDEPGDSEAIDFLFFVHDRHQGNLEASRRYLAWETGLVDQLDDEERAMFRLIAADGPRR